MIPVRDHNPSRRIPWVTGALIAANVTVFLLTWEAQSDPRAALVLLGDWALIPARITAGEGWVTFFSAMFMHAGILHLAGNMLFLWIFGDNMEEAFGHLGFLLFYLACGIAAGWSQIATDPFSQVPMVGASGAVAGVLGGYLLLYPRARIDVLVIFIVFATLVAMPAWLVLGVWFAIQLAGSLISAGAEGGGVAFAAHAGGFAAGFILTLPIWAARGGRDWWRHSGGHPQHPPTRARPRMTRNPQVRRRR